MNHMSLYITLQNYERGLSSGAHYAKFVNASYEIMDDIT